jgi:hypothetical protein
MSRSSRESESGPLTLGQALAAQVRLIVWCKSCNRRTEPDIATQVAQHAACIPVSDWARLLRCTELNSNSCSSEPVSNPAGHLFTVKAGKR